MIGFDKADIRRIKAQELRSRGMTVLEEIENGDDITEGMEQIYIEAPANQ